MKRIGSKLAIAVIAVAAIVLIAGVGTFAYWSVSQNVSGNQIASGHMSIAVTGFEGSTLQSLDVSDLMPGQSGNTIYEVKSAAGNPNTDFSLTIPTVTGEGTLKDNVKVAFCLMTDLNAYYWLKPSGAVAFVPGSEDTDVTYVNNGAVMSEYSGMSWSDLLGYKNLPGESIRHVKVYYYLPVDCAEDCHDSTVTFDMSFELLQSH